MVRTIGLISIKGGVGKTTLSASLAADLANNHNKKVLLVDANYSAPNLGIHMNVVNPEKTIHDVLVGMRVKKAIHKRYGVDVIPGSYIYKKDVNVLKLRNKIAKVKDNYDYVIIDSSPSLNDEVLSAILASDNLFVVTTPDYPTLIASMVAAKKARARNKPVSGIIINKIREPSYEIGIEEIEDAIGIPVVAKIPDDKTAVKSLFTRIPISLYNSKSSFARELAKLSSALAGHQEKISFFKKLFGSSFGVEKDAVNRQILKLSFYTPMFK